MTADVSMSFGTSWSSFPRTRTLGLFLLILSVVGGNAAIERPMYRTAYACEGSLLHISCDDGQLIYLIRANYGRFSIAICNEHGNTDWSVNCIAPRSFRVLQERCNQQSSCSIQASTTVFGDPCASTFKYLEAHYQCLPVTTTTLSTPPRFAPPWLMTTTTTQPAWVTMVTRPGGGAATDGPVQAGPSSATSAVAVMAASSQPRPSSSTSPASEQMPTVVTVTTSTATIATHRSLVQPPSNGETNHGPPIITVRPPRPPNATAPTPTKQPISTTTVAAVARSTTNAPKWDLMGDHCAPISLRDLNWNWTKKGEVSVMPCPIGTTGMARWKCSSHPGRWLTESLDLSDCKSAWVMSLVSRINAGDSVVNVASDLARFTTATDDGRKMYGGDMIESTALLKKMAHKMSERLKMHSTQKEKVVDELMESVVDASSNLLDYEQRLSWHDLSRLSQMKTATSLLAGLEENAFLLADQMTDPKTIVHSDNNILMAIKVQRTYIRRELCFPDADDLANSVWTQSPGSIVLPVEAFSNKTRNDSGLVKVVFFTFNNIDELLQPFNVEGSDKFDAEGKNKSWILNSHVISASFVRDRHVRLQAPVTITLKHLLEENMTNPVCVYWNYTSTSWSRDGCDVVVSNQSHTICSCNHLTNFAVLMDVRGVQLSEKHEAALQMITYVGCIISIVCLALAFCTFTFFRGLKSDRVTIHKNLCICLLIAEALFLAGITQTDNPILCSVIAGLLHFFFLCAFAWMFLEGFQLYVMLIEVFESEKSRIRWYYALAYGIPALIVTISCVVDPFSYRTDKYCWLRTDNYFIFSFVGPVIAVIMANLVFLFIAIYMMCRHGNVSAATKNKEQSKLANINSWIRGSLILVFLLGLTWTFGLLYLNEDSVIMAYIFTVLNSLQGLFIFVFHCIRNEKVQKEYRKLIRRSRCLPSCMREKAKERRSSFYVNSNGTASMPNSSAPSLVRQSYLSKLWSSGRSKTPPTSSISDGSISKAPAIDHPQALVPGKEGDKYSSFATSNGNDSAHDKDSSCRTLGSGRYHPRCGALSINYGGVMDDIAVTNRCAADSQCPTDTDTTAPTNTNTSSCKLQPSPDDRFRHLPKSGPASHHLHGNHRQGRPVKLPRPIRLSPFNHIYIDIESRDGEPVYEEIEREQLGSSDYSDEDGRRRSDISRQSSGSYGDNRPLINHGNQDTPPGVIGSQGEHLHGHTRSPLVMHPQVLPHPFLASAPPYRSRQKPVSMTMDVMPPPYHHHPSELDIRQVAPPQYNSSVVSSHGHRVARGAAPSDMPHHAGGVGPAVPADNPMFVAMLDGRKVVCRLQPDQQRDSMHRKHGPSRSEC